VNTRLIFAHSSSCTERSTGECLLTFIAVKTYESQRRDTLRLSQWSEIIEIQYLDPGFIHMILHIARTPISSEMLALDAPEEVSALLLERRQHRRLEGFWQIGASFHLRGRQTIEVIIIQRD